MSRAKGHDEELAAKRRFRRALAGGHAVCLVFLLISGAIALTGGGLVRLLFLGVGLTVLLLEAALLLITLPRQPGPVPARDDGSVLVESPLSLVVVLVGAWLTLLALGLAWLVVALSGALASVGPRGGVTLLLAVLASVPDLVRLLRGRLYRWRIEADAYQVHYQGYRTNVTLTWSEVAKVDSTAHPPRVSLLRRNGEASVVVPVVTLPFEPAAIAAALAQLRRRAGHRLSET